MKHLHNFLTIFFPYKCFSCNSIIDTNDLFCHQCWGEVYFSSDPKCQICSHNFTLEPPDQKICSECEESPNEFDKLEFLFKFDDKTKKIIHGIKYYDQQHAIPLLCDLIRKRYPKLIEQTDYFIAIPMHKDKLRKRYYNQSLLIANCLGKLSDKPVLSSALLKIKATENQSNLGRKARRTNLKGAIIINEKLKLQLDNKIVTLVDDVFTTGATINECAKAIKLSYKRSQVQAITIAKTDIDEYLF